MKQGIHGEKLTAALANEKLPSGDKERLEATISEYNAWLHKMEEISAESLPEFVRAFVDALIAYKFVVDVNLIFDSPNDFLYRQKGQLKIDNTVIEEFLPILVWKCLNLMIPESVIDIAPQTPTFSSVYFNSSLSNPSIGGGLTIKTKDQDFAVSRRLYLRSSYSEAFDTDKTVTIATNIGYILAEIKTNLDKTMFQEASATARDIKLAVSGAKYFLLCDYLDMTPISSATTDIDEILILRKAKRISSNIRAKYSTFDGRQSSRAEYIKYLHDNPYSVEVFQRFIEHILAQFSNETLVEANVLNDGYF
jgi:hypothetical protein